MEKKTGVLRNGTKGELGKREIVHRRSHLLKGRTRMSRNDQWMTQIGKGTSGECPRALSNLIENDHLKEIKGVLYSQRVHTGREGGLHTSDIIAMAFPHTHTHTVRIYRLTLPSPSLSFPSCLILRLAPIFTNVSNSERAVEG